MDHAITSCMMHAAPQGAPVQCAELALAIQLECHLDARALVRGHVQERRLAPVQLLVQIKVFHSPACSIVHYASATHVTCKSVIHANCMQDIWLWQHACATYRF